MPRASRPPSSSPTGMSCSALTVRADQAASATGLTAIGLPSWSASPRRSLAGRGKRQKPSTKVPCSVRRRCLESLAGGRDRRKEVCSKCIVSSGFRCKKGSASPRKRLAGQSRERHKRKGEFQFLITALKVNGEAWLGKSDGFAASASNLLGYKS